MDEKPVTPLEIDAITSKLSKDAKAAFFDVFWKTWSSNGFGTLTKKDTELLIFDCLRAALGDAGPANIHEWARLLRLTPAKIFFSTGSPLTYSTPGCALVMTRSF